MHRGRVGRSTGAAATVAVLVLVAGACTPGGQPSPETPADEPAPATPPEPEPDADDAPEPEPEDDPDLPAPDDGPADGDADALDEGSEDDRTQLTEHGVSAGDEAAVQAGLAMLREGGTAVDAAVAAAFAVSVVEPFASGLGGGGAALLAGPDQEPEAYDYREVVAADGIVPASETGIPGFVAGMAQLHEEHGALAWEDLLAPSIELAEDGVGTTGILADQLRSARSRLPEGELPELFPDGSPLDAGDQLVQPELADTLRTIADEGPGAFYGGDLGARLADSVDGVDVDSLEAYEVQRSEPPRGVFGDLEVVGAAPPLPGAAFVQQLQVAEALDVGSPAPGSADHLHRMAMAWRVADRTIDAELGDPDFVDVPVETLVDPEVNAELAADIDDGSLLAGAASPVTAANTTHVTAVDEDGTVVSMTNTLTNFWGSGQRELGFFLNDQLRRFSIGGTNNEPEAGRRSVSWSLPVMVLDDQGRPVLGIGSPGGRRIPTILGNVLVRWGLHGEPLDAAVEAPRYHLEGDVLEFETLPDDGVAASLLDRGYAGLEEPTPPYYFGSVQALEIDHDRGTVGGALDPRREGAFTVEDVDG